MCECPTMYDESIVVARKQHRCCECNTPILKGERYESCSGMWDGQFNRYATCVPCMEIRKEASAHVKGGDCCELPYFGGLMEYLSDGFPDTDGLLTAVKTRWEAARGAVGKSGNDHG